MRNKLETLIRLHNIDHELLQLEKSKGDLPQRVESLRNEFKALEAELQQQQDKIKELEAKKARQAGEAEVLKEQLKKYRNQLYQVKNNKEYDAITIQIEESETKRDELEYNNLELEEQIQELETGVQSLHEKIHSQTEELEQQQKDLEVVLSKSQDREEKLLKQRQDIQKELPRPLYSSYERIRIGRGGAALAFLDRGACSECSSRIPPQRGVEIRQMDKLILCETCGRILVYDPERENSHVELAK